MQERYSWCDMLTVRRGSAKFHMGGVSGSRGRVLESVAAKLGNGRV